MMVMIFLLSFNQCALWNLKDSLVITTSGAEVIPFIKVWAILPSSVLLTIIFTWLSNRFSREKVFYLLTGSFLIFYALFAFVLYPYRDFMHPFESATYLEGMLPAGFKGLIAMYRHWTFTGFYVMCELWNTIVISILFWGFANRITHVNEAGRFYSVLGVAFNMAIMATGIVSIAIGQQAAVMSSHFAWEYTMRGLMFVIIVSGLLTMALFRWMHRNVVSDVIGQPASQLKDKLSFWDSLRYVISSPHLVCIAVMVVGYSLVINLVEVVWKDQLRSLHPVALDYNHYISGLQIFQGLLAIVLSLSLSEMIKRMGWTRIALITPLLMLFFCVFFFGVLFFRENLTGFFLAFVGISPLALVVFMGAVQNGMSKACKYSLFDSTKEMAFIPLCSEGQLKGKTAIDGIGVRLGKSGGSMIHQGLLIIFATVSASAPYVGVILMAALILWVIAVCILGQKQAMSSYAIVTSLQR